MMQRIIFALFCTFSSLPAFHFFTKKEPKKPVRLAHIHIFTHAGQRIITLEFHSGKYKNILITEIIGGLEDSCTAQTMKPCAKQPDITLDLKTIF